MRALSAVASFVLFLVLATLAMGGPLEDARQQARAGHLAAAIEQARAALKQTPADARTARLLQDLLVRAGRVEEAEKLASEGVQDPTLQAYLAARVLEPAKAVRKLKQLKGQDGAPVTMRLDLGWALLRAGSHAAANSEAKAYAKECPEDPEGHYLLGRVLQKKSKWGAAREAHQKALDLEPAEPYASVALAEVLHELDEAGAARAVLRASLDAYSTNPLLRLGLAQDQVRAGEWEAAEKTLVALAAERTTLQADGYAWLGYVRRLMGELEESLAAANKALEIDKNNLVGLETKGFCLLKAKKFQQALDTYALAMELDRTRVEPYVGIGYAQTQMGEVKYAEDMLEKALKLDKEHIDANLKMAIVQYLKGKTKSARKYLKVVQKQDPSNLAMFRYYGYCSLAEGKAKDAQKWLKQALEVQPEDSKTVRMMGRTYLDLGKNEEALTMFERAVSIDAKNYWAHFDLAKCHDRMGEYELAKASYEDAIDLAADFMWPHLYLAEIYDEVDGDDEQAVEHYKRYLELDGPDEDEKIKKRIEQLTKD